MTRDDTTAALTTAFAQLSPDRQQQVLDLAQQLREQQQPTEPPQQYP